MSYQVVVVADGVSGDGGTVSAEGGDGGGTSTGSASIGSLGGEIVLRVGAQGRDALVVLCILIRRKSMQEL